MKTVPQLPKLLEMVSDKLAAQGWGALAELARILEVKPSHLQRWLKGQSEPGGRVTLFLLAWVSEPIRKQASKSVAKPVQKAKKAR